jgi:transaldolase
MTQKNGNTGMLLQPNLGFLQPQAGAVRTSLRALVTGEGGTVRGEEKYLGHVLDLPLAFEVYRSLQPVTRRLGVTVNFRQVLDTFDTPSDETPPGFRVEYVLETEGVVRVDLVRDISYDRNGQKRPTKVLFSADSANPYEVAPVKDLLANLTCNPGIIYDLFINNPKANVGGKFKTRDEVMAELGRILGPGADISVELNNPFEEDTGKLLEEAAKFREMLSPYRVVIKVPHTGPVNRDNVGELLEGDKRFKRHYDAGSTGDMSRGHRLALLLREHGYRINFTLMFEPCQTALALQAKPYFINSFVRQRLMQSLSMKKCLDQYAATQDRKQLEGLRAVLVDKDYLSPDEGAAMDLLAVKTLAEGILRDRGVVDLDNDGLDGVRHNLRVLKQCRLDTRLIICSMEGEKMYPDIDRLLTEPEFECMLDRVVVTAEPGYLAKFMSAANVVGYQRRFMNAAKGMK